MVNENMSFNTYINCFFYKLLLNRIESIWDMILKRFPWNIQYGLILEIPL